jgi:hypothetical protein
MEMAKHSANGQTHDGEFVSGGSPNTTSPPRRTTRAETRQHLVVPHLVVPVAPLETIRKRLGLSLEAMSEAIGYASGTYGGFVRDGHAPKTAALAVEALSRRQAAADTVFLIRVVKGTPTVTLIDDVETATIAGRPYLLVPDAR